MLHLETFTQLLSGVISCTNLPLLFDLLQSFLCISHSSGVRPLSRYCDWSERSIFRLIADPIDWTLVNAYLFVSFTYDSAKTYLLVADETIEGKAGKSSAGLGMFYSSSAQKPIPSINMFGLSLVCVETGTTSPMGFSQVLHTAQDKARIHADKEKKLAGKGKPRGRQKGIPQKEKAATETSIEKPAFRAFKDIFTRLLKLLLALLPGFSLSYVVLDTAYGNSSYLQLILEKNLSIISKLRTDTALFYPYQGQKSKTKPKKYGDKVDFTCLKTQHLVETATENGYRYETFQYQAWNKSLHTLLLNVVTVRATNLKTNKSTWTHFFSNDLALSAQRMLQYYQLRFQIEFDFRDAKQLFGLHKLKNYHPNQLNNMYQMTFSALLFAKIKQQEWASKLKLPKLSLIDLKTIYKAQNTLKQVINNLPEDAIPFFSPDFIANFVPKDISNKQ